MHGPDNSIYSSILIRSKNWLGCLCLKRKYMGKMKIQYLAFSVLLFCVSTISIAAISNILPIPSQKQTLRFERIKNLAGQGDPSSQYLLGLMYEDGVGTSINIIKAFEWYYKSANTGYLKAQVQLGVMYWHGEGVEKKYNEAISWLEKAAIQGHMGSQVELGIAYMMGYGVDVNFQKSLKWSLKAADQGDYWSK